VHADILGQTSEGLLVRHIGNVAMLKQRFEQVSWFEWTNCLSEQDPMLIVRQVAVPPDVEMWHGITIPKKLYTRIQTDLTYLLRPHGRYSRLAVLSNSKYSIPRWMLPEKVLHAVESWCCNSAADATATFAERYGRTQYAVRLEDKREFYDRISAQAEKGDIQGSA